MSSFVGSFQSFGGWQHLSRLSLLLHFGVSTSHTLSSLVLLNLYCPCLFMFILYCLQFMPISFAACEKFLLPFCCPLISLFSCCFQYLIMSSFYGMHLWIYLAVGYLCHTLSVLSNRLVFGSSCQGCLFFLAFFLSVFQLQAAYHHLSWWNCILHVSSCWLCMVCNWFLYYLFLVLFYLGMTLFHDVFNL